MVVNIKIVVFFDIMPSSFIDGHQRVIGTWWRCRQQVPSKGWYPTTKLHGVTSQKTTLLTSLSPILVTSTLKMDKVSFFKTLEPFPLLNGVRTQKKQTNKNVTL
jgi:hypothetical protein